MCYRSTPPYIGHLVTLGLGGARHHRGWPCGGTAGTAQYVHRDKEFRTLKINCLTCRDCGVGPYRSLPNPYRIVLAVRTWDRISCSGQIILASIAGGEWSVKSATSQGREVLRVGREAHSGTHLKGAATQATVKTVIRGTGHFSRANRQMRRRLKNSSYFFSRVGVDGGAHVPSGIEGTLIEWLCLD